MNKHQIKGRLNEAAGEVQEQAGKMIGSKDQELKGHAREHSGKAEKTAGDLKEVLKESGRH